MGWIIEDRMDKMVTGIMGWWAIGKGGWIFYVKVNIVLVEYILFVNEIWFNGFYWVMRLYHILKIFII